MCNEELLVVVLSFPKHTCSLDSVDSRTCLTGTLETKWWNFVSEGVAHHHDVPTLASIQACKIVWMVWWWRLEVLHGLDIKGDFKNYSACACAIVVVFAAF